MGYNHQHYGTAGFFYLHTVPGILAWDRFSVLKSRHSCRERSINMDNWLARTRLLLGDEAVNSLRHSRVAVLGLGGVGGAAAEAICRSGVGAMLLADYDRVDITNLNRQLIAVTSTVGHDKTEAAARRLRDINPELDLTLREGRLTPENLPEVLDWQPDYILDCIDNVTAKLALTVLCRERGIRLITCLGTGNRLDPSMLRVGNLPDTAGTGCPLSRIMRKELRRRGITDLTVVYSLEVPVEPAGVPAADNGRHPPASMAFVPPAAGFLMASYAVRDLLGLLPPAGR